MVIRSRSGTLANLHRRLIQAEADIGDGPHRQQENDREGCGRDPDRTREPIQAERKREVCGEGDPDKIEGEQKAPSNEPREQQW